MQKLLFTTAAVALCASLSAQSYCTAPDGYEAKTGAYYTTHPFWLLTGRWQVGDPSIKKSGKTTVLLAQDFRTTTYLTYSTSRNVSKSWTKLTLTLAHTDCAKFSKTYSLNYKGTGTEVFNAKFSTPAISTGSPTQKWGNAGSMTFSKIFLYNGKDDLLQDYTYAGGKLANGSTPSASYSHSYYMDGVRCSSIAYLYADSTYAPGSKWLPGSPYNKAGKNCVDSSQTTTYYDSYAYLYAYIYGDAYTTTSLRGRLRVSSANIYYMAKTAKAIAALTIGSSDAGVTIPGAKCQKLHANMGFPLAVINTTTNSTGHAYTLLSTTPAPYSNAFAGVPVCWQGAWEDSKTKQLALSTATKIVLPKKPVADCNVCYTYEYFRGTTKYHNGPYSGSFSNSIERYRKK